MSSSIPNLNRLQAFQQAYANLALLPLLQPEQLVQFHVHYGKEVLEELEQLLEDSPTADSKIVFAGHRGCGKSTLLAELGRQLNDRYFVVAFSIAETIEMSDVNHVNILFAIGINLMSCAATAEVKIPRKTREEFERWFARKTRIEEKKIQAEASSGFDLLKLIGFVLKTDATIRTELRQEFEHKMSDLVDKINEIAAAIEAATGQPILGIIDDLDKLDLAVVRDIYRDHIKTLFQPSFRIIFTIPISSSRDVTLRAYIQSEADAYVEMPVIKLFAKGEGRSANSNPKEESVKILCEVLHKRVPDHLIEPVVARELVLASGGVLRELIRLAQQCCRICLRLIRKPEHADIVIDRAVLQEAMNKFRLDFATPLGKADYEILQKTYTNFEPDDPKDSQFLDLLHGLQIIEYRNYELWYDVHPILIELLKSRGLIANG